MRHATYIMGAIVAIAASNADAKSLIAYYSRSGKTKAVAPAACIRILKS